ncbi:MAG: cyclic nucleotide-binding domain-containing protein [Chitinispirillaceae bacterium]|nr:cyclic nucleotide-binding domain-containing protein [Chitinispirillaceae bacterium]
MTQSQRSGLKTGKRPVQQQIRSFKPGETLFSEGSTGRELFIIHEGKVGIYKDGPDGRVELAQVDRGSIIGEMSLLDTLPRSATVVAIDPVKALVIGYAQFQSVMQTIPVWLQSIIKIVVSRLRDANRRVDQPILRNRERGLAALIKLLLPVHRQEINGCIALSCDTIHLEAFYICRLRKKETTQLLDSFQKRGVLTPLTKNDAPFVGIPDNDILNLYEEFLILKDQRQSFKELSIPKETISVLSNIVYVAQKLGRETDDGTSLSKRALISDLGLGDTPGTLDKHLLELRRRNLINLLPHENDTEILFRKEVPGRIKKIQEWVPRFSMEFK